MPPPAKIIPDGYHSVQPYLILPDARAAIDFYVIALNATERLCMKHPSGRVAHAEIVFGDSCIMLADEHPELTRIARGIMVARRSA